MKLCVVLSVLLLAGCYEAAEYVPQDVTTLEEVSQPYLDANGPPEEVTTYTSGAYQAVDWWWWTKGLEVSFINSPYDDYAGWRVDSIYRFTPIG